MSHPFYYVSMSAGGTSNIFIEMFARRNTTIRFEDACACTLIPIGNDFVPYNSGHCKYVQEIVADFNVPFKTVNWVNNLECLDKLVKSVRPNTIWIGTCIDDSLPIIKNYFKDRVLTIGINYLNEDFEFLYNKWIRYQIGFLISQADHKFNNILEATQFCIDVGPEYFGYTIPKTKNTNADYVVNFQDIYNEKKFKYILTELGANCTDADWEFYRNYIKYC